MIDSARELAERTPEQLVLRPINGSRVFSRSSPAPTTSSITDTLRTEQQQFPDIPDMTDDGRGPYACLTVLPEQFAERVEQKIINGQTVYITDKETGAEMVSHWMVALLSARNDLEKPTHFGLATGSTPLPVYAKLIESSQAGDANFSRTHTINLDEYLGIKGHLESYRQFMKRELVDHINLPPAHFHIFESVPSKKQQDIKREIKRIKDALNRYPIHLQLLGIGINGHIGFNEPGSTKDSTVRKVQLDEDTRKANARFFDENLDEVPQYALTLGIADILKAQAIVTMAWGAAKANAVYSAITQPPSPKTPASFLQDHPKAVWVIDKEAASLLLNQED